MKKIKEYLKAAYDSVTARINALFLAALPVFELLKDQLPDIQPYLPPHLYQYVGLSVVILNIVVASHRKVKANGQNAA
jgi:hypothetical protein